MRLILFRGCCGRDRMVVRFTTTCAISTYHLWTCEFKSCSWQGVLNATFCDKVCQWLAADRWFSSGTPVSSTNNTDRQDITEILLKVALSTINLTLTLYLHYYMVFNATFNIITREIISDFSNKTNNACKWPDFYLLC